MSLHQSPAAICAEIQTASGHPHAATHTLGAAGHPIPDDAASHGSHPTSRAPHHQEPFRTSPVHAEAIEDIIELYRLRVDMIKARTKLILQAQAGLRRFFDGDKELAASTFMAATKDEFHEHRARVSPYISALAIFDDQQAAYDKELVKAVKRLPIYSWVKDIKGFGDIGFACIVGECSGNNNVTGEFYSLGDFRSVSAVWKRMGLAVINGERQRKKAGDDALLHGYSPSRRSVMWNVGNSLILGMGKFRPVFGEDVEANEDYTYLQKVFAGRARYEAQRLPHKCGALIKESKTGKDSYTAHAANRAKRYAEKRLLRMLYSEWRRSMG